MCTHLYIYKYMCKCGICAHVCILMCTCVSLLASVCMLCVCVWAWNFIVACSVANMFDCVNLCMCCVHALAHEVSYRRETHSDSFALITHEAVLRLVLNLCWVSCTGCY